MKALVKTRPEPGLYYVDIPEPPIVHPDDVKFKVEYCAIGVGETKVYDWNAWAAADKTLVLPTVIGHEASGVVVEVGSEVKHFNQARRPGGQRPSDLLRDLPPVPQRFHQHVREREIYGNRRG